MLLQMGFLLNLWYDFGEILLWHLNNFLTVKLSLPNTISSMNYKKIYSLSDSFACAVLNSLWSFHKMGTFIEI